MASSSKPASTSMTIARAALAAMCQPISGTRVTSARFSGPVEAELGVVGRLLVEDLDAPVGLDVGERW